MPVTEREAGQKYCPYKFSTERNEYGCAGEDCMLWRWYNTERKVKEQEIGRGKYSPAEYVMLPKSQWTGYCGLGGKP